MKSKYLVLILLIVADLPFYLLLLRVLFRGKRLSGVAGGKEAGTGGDGRPAATPPHAGGDQARPAEQPSVNRDEPLWRSLFDLGFLRGEGGGNKLFLFVLTAALIVYIEYSVVLGLFPSLRDAVLF
jgi:hypothetical protein